MGHRFITGKTFTLCWFKGWSLSETMMKPFICSLYKYTKIAIWKSNGVLFHSFMLMPKKLVPQYSVDVIENLKRGTETTKVLRQWRYWENQGTETTDVLKQQRYWDNWSTETTEILRQWRYWDNWYTKTTAVLRQWSYWDNLGTETTIVLRQLRS